MDTIGRNVKLKLTGASHAPEVGLELAGIPAGVELDMDAIRFDLERRSARNHAAATPRHEADDFIIRSGIMEGVTDGSVISVGFPNRAHDRSEYRPIARPSHADYCAFVRSGGREDISGGGRYSGRMTLPLVFAGSVCRQILKGRGITIIGHIGKIGDISDDPFDPMMQEPPKLDPFFPLVDVGRRAEMEALLLSARAGGDTLSAEAEVAVTGLPVGLGEPLFDGLEGTLSRYLYAIPGLRGVEFGRKLTHGSRMNDQFTDGGGTVTNNSGGVNGGMANGMPLVFRCWFRPVPSISLSQTGFDLIEKKPVPLTIKGRHDTCILPRGLVAVEAAACIAVLDLLMEYDGRAAEGLAEMRRALDAADAEMMRLYAERMDISKRIGEYKRMNLLPIADPEREAEVIRSRAALLPGEYRRGGEELVGLLMESSKRVQRAGLDLYLIGMPDCGKTRTGRKLVSLLDMPLADTDRMIADHEGRTIDEIFASDGEGYFRDIESEALRAVAERGGLIVATGGGLPMREENARLMRSSGVTVFLDRKLERLHGQRTQGRPLIAAYTPEETNRKIDALYHARRERYLAAADIVVDPDEPGAAERIAEAYLRWVESGIL